MKINWKKAWLPLLGCILLIILGSSFFIGVDIICKHVDLFESALNEEVPILGMSITYRVIIIFMSAHIFLHTCIYLYVSLFTYLFKEFNKHIIKKDK